MSSKRKVFALLLAVFGLACDGYVNATVTVTDAEGLPVSEALVCLGYPGRSDDPRAWSAHLTAESTDASGCTDVGLVVAPRAHQVPITVWKPGFAAATGEIPSGTNDHLEVSLGLEGAEAPSRMSRRAGIQPGCGNAVEPGLPAWLQEDPPIPRLAWHRVLENACDQLLVSKE